MCGHLRKFWKYTGRFDKRRVTTIDTQHLPTMVKSYQRFTLKRSFGVVVAPSANIVVDRAGQLAVCGSLEDVIVWNIKRGVRVNTTRERCWPRSHTAVPISSCRATHSRTGQDTATRRLRGDLCGVEPRGDAGGSWLLRWCREAVGDCDCHDCGHLYWPQACCHLLAVRERGSAACVGLQGHRRCSVGHCQPNRALQVMIMPPVHHCCTNSRCGCPVFRVNRLRGHRDEVTDARFVASGAKLITSSKDTFLKVCTRGVEGWGFSAHAVVGFLTLAAFFALFLSRCGT